MELLVWLLPVLLGGLTSVLLQVFKRASAWIDARTPLQKRVLLVVVAWGASKASAFLGVQLPATVFDMDPTTLNAALTALAAHVSHTLYKRRTQ